VQQLLQRVRVDDQTLATCVGPYISDLCSRPQIAAAAQVLHFDSNGAYSPGNIRIDWRGGEPRLPDVPPMPDVPTHRVQGDELDFETSGPDLAYDRAWRRGRFDDAPREAWFGGSRTPRPQRPAHVTHPVGTVYTHTRTGARGVVIGWDLRLEAPREWADANEGSLDYETRLARLYEPHYSVLEEVKGPGGEMIAIQRYVVSMCQPMLAPPTCLRIEHPAAALTHPELHHYFSSFSPKRGYTPNDELAMLYPQG